MTEPVSGGAPQSLVKGVALSMPQKQPYAWTVPVVLLIGIAMALAMHWPVYTGVLTGLVWSVGYARKLGQGWRATAAAALTGMRRLWLVFFVLLLIGAVVGLWMGTGTIPLLVHLGSALLHPENLIWMSFLLASALSMVIGSSIATWSVLGPPLMAMTPLPLVPWVAGALISGGMVGDRSSPMSTSTLLMASTVRLPLRQVLRQLNATAVVPFCLTLLSYFTANRMFAANRAGLVSAWPIIHGLPLVPPALVIGLALLRVPLLYNLSASMLVSSGIASVNAHSSLGALWILTWRGGQMQNAHHFLQVGGMSPMVSAVVLIAAAGAFQGVTDLNGSVRALTDAWFASIRRRSVFVASSFAVCTLYAMTVGSQMLAVLMSGNTLRPHFPEQGLTDVSLLQVIGDAAELLPALIPWNLLGLQAVVILGVGPGVADPFAWFVGFTLLVSVIRLARALRQRVIPLPSGECTLSPCE